MATLRKANGLTQQDVAERLSISDRTLSSWETGRTAPDILLLPALADLYGVTVDEILRGERKQGEQTATAEISEKAQRNMRKSRYSKFCAKRVLLTGLAIAGGILFLIGGALMLYTSAPLWLDVIVIIAGAMLTLVCSILLIYYEHAVEQSDGIVLDDDLTENNKAFVLTLRHARATALIYISLPYILGAILFLIIFFANGLNNYWVSVGDINIKVDSTTPTVILVVLCAAIGAIPLLCGLISASVMLNKLGNADQQSNHRRNVKLLGKLCGFGAIPFAIAVVLLGIFCSPVLGDITKTRVRYFSAESEQEVYENFQTLEISADEKIEADDETGEWAIIPAGKYFLNFQSEEFVTCNDNEILRLINLGNGFYGVWEFYGYSATQPEIYRCEVYCLKNGKSASDLAETDDVFDCLCFYNSYDTVKFETSDGSRATTVNVAYNSYFSPDRWDYENSWFGYTYHYRIDYSKNKGEWSYVLEYVYDYSPLFIWLFIGVTAAVIITVTVIYFTKRKKIKYTF